MCPAKVARKIFAPFLILYTKIKKLSIKKLSLALIKNLCYSIVTMKIFILDKDTVSYGDVGFEEIEALGNVTYFNKLPSEEIIERCQGAEAILVNKSAMTEKIISSIPTLKYIGAFATGYNNIDLPACKKYGVTFCNAPAYSTHAVAQHAISLMLSFAGNTHRYIASVKNGDWILSDGFSYYAYPQYEVFEKTFAVIGYGEIGKAAAKIAEALGMRVIVNTRTKPKDCPFEVVSLSTVLKEADYLSLHCPLNKDTAEIINKHSLSLMKKNAVIINTARGGLINENDLAEALKSGALRGACLDVAAKEPMSADNPLYKLDNCIITPHVAWLPVETRERLIHVVADNLKAFINGTPKNVID